MKKIKLKLTAREAVMLEATLKAVLLELASENKRSTEMEDVLEKLENKLGVVEGNSFTDDLAEDLANVD